jgi:hypothetical protein
MRILIFLLVLIAGCTNNEYRVFQQVFFNEKTKKYTYSYIIAKGCYRDTMAEVLEIFGEDYYIENDELYITKKLWKDKETLWGYCNKADELINERKIKKQIEYANIYVPFQRVRYDLRTEKFVTDSDFSKQYRDNMVNIFEFHREDYYIEDDILYISGTLWLDKEWLWNLCHRANGYGWIDWSGREYY